MSGWRTSRSSASPTRLCKLLVVDDPTKGFTFLAHTGLSDQFFPELNKLKMEDEGGGYKDVFTHTLAVIRNTKPELRLRLSALFHDIAKPETFKRNENKAGQLPPSRSARLRRRLATSCTGSSSPTT